jgi:hypothetical protein
MAEKNTYSQHLSKDNASVPYTATATFRNASMRRPESQKARNLKDGAEGNAGKTDTDEVAVL